MSKIIETLRSAVEHRERKSLDDIDVADLNAQIERLRWSVHSCGPTCSMAGCLNRRLMDEKARDEDLMRRAMAAMEQAGQIDTYRNYDMEWDAMKALRERLK